MNADIKRGKIVFVDDEPASVEHLVNHLRAEGYTNTSVVSTVKTLGQVVELGADLVYLDITGVAATLAPEDEGLAVLQHLKKHAPWTRVVVLSGSAFPAGKAHDLASADLCVSKGSLSLAEIVDLTHEQLREALAPEIRNPRVLETILRQLDDSSISTFRRWRLKRALRKGLSHQGDQSFDWKPLIRLLRGVRTIAGDLSPLIDLLRDDA